MNLKKFEAETEEKAIAFAKEELGENVLILNIKRIKPKGFFAFFKKSTYEVTAAYESKPLVPIESEAEKQRILSDSNGKSAVLQAAKKELKNKSKEREAQNKLKEKDDKISELSEKLDETEKKLKEVMVHLSSKPAGRKQKYKNSLLQFFYDRLTAQGVAPDIADEILEELEKNEENTDLDINCIVKVVYNKIIKMLKQGEVLRFEKKDGDFAKNVVFIGPTGVGKTTTIAKLSSDFIINKNANTAFITADTYRIAAVEQLKTYAEILNSDVKVVYTPEDLGEEIINLRAINDFVFIDTAGRSHKNSDNINELKEFIDAVEDPIIYLVLSVTTKYEDLINIIETYDKFTDFSLIFTKLDESSTLGSMVNICHLTGKSISYVTSGQNVPDDFEILKPEKIAKTLLGSMYE